MKKIIYISFLLLITSCNSQDKKDNEKINKPQPVKHITMDTQYNYRQLISSKTEYFDIKKFYKNNDDGIGITYESENGTKIEESAGDEGGWFMSNSTPKNSLFTIHKEFNSKGVIVKKGITFKNAGCHLGVWYEFDDSGKLIKETDTDKNYKITFSDIAKYCTENNISLNDENTIINRGINNDTKENSWEIEYRGSYNNKFGSNIIIEIDSNTGEVQKVTCINGKHNDSVEVLYDIQEEKKKSAQIYKTHEGKNYTKAEWEVYEEKQYEEYCKRTGKPYTPKNQESRIVNQDNKKSFLAKDNEQGDENTPKKNKGFLGGLFS